MSTRIFPRVALSWLVVLLGVTIFNRVPMTIAGEQSPQPADEGSPTEPPRAPIPPPAPSPKIFATPDGSIASLESPIAAAFDDRGQLFVIEPWAARVRVFRWETRAPLRSFGSPGTDPTRFHEPSDIAVGNGVVWVADRANHRVQGFNVDGSFHLLIDGGDEPLLAPMGIGTDGSLVAIADTGNNRVRIFDRQGRPIRSVSRFPRQGSSPGTAGRGTDSLRAPHDAAIDRHGFVHVSDTGNHRIVTFSPDGEFIRAIGGRGTAPGFFDQPRSLVVFEDHIYVCDTRNHRVQVFDLGGRVVGGWGVHAVTPHDEEGRLHYPTSIAIDPREPKRSERRSAVLCEPFEDRLQAFHDGVDPERPPPRALPGNPIPDLHFGQRIARRGSLAGIITEGETAVALYDLRHKTPIRIHNLGRFGSESGQLVAPTDLYLGSEKRITICDPWARRIEVYRHQWSPLDKVRFRPRLTQLVRSIDVEALQRETEALRTLPPLAFDQIEGGTNGELYFLDQNQGVFVVLDGSFQYQRHFGGLGDDPGRFRLPTDFAFSRKGELIYAVDAALARVQVLRNDGTHLLTIGGRGDGPSGFRRPFGVATLDDGTALVTDMARHRVVRFDHRGGFLESWGNSLLGAGEKDDRPSSALSPLDRLVPSYLYKPAGIATASRGNEVLVLDWGHHRVQWTQPPGRSARVFGSRAFLSPRGR